SDRTIEACLDYLRHVGIHWSLHPGRDEVDHELAEIWRRLADRPMEALLELPRMTNAEAFGTMDVLLEALPATMSIDENLRALVTCRMVNLSLEDGNSDGSPIAYTWLAVILGHHFGDYRTGSRFGSLGLDLVERRGLDRFKARVLETLAIHVIPFTQH